MRQPCPDDGGGNVGFIMLRPQEPSGRQWTVGLAAGLDFGAPFTFSRIVWNET